MYGRSCCVDSVMWPSASITGMLGMGEGYPASPRGRFLQPPGTPGGWGVGSPAKLVQNERHVEGFADAAASGLDAQVVDATVGATRLEVDGGRLTRHHLPGQAHLQRQRA